MGYVIDRLPPISHPDLLVGADTADDAAVFRISDDLALVQTVDFFTPVVDDPYDFGRIAAANSLSDVYAMGARPILALNIVGFPSSVLPLDHLVEILRGGAAVAVEAGVVVGGGHTVDDREPKYGMVVTGVVRPGEQVTNTAAAPGDLLVLTKPLGTGVIATAIKRGVAEADIVAEATASMAALNRGASEAALACGVRCMTDVTGFGLLGHLLEMCEGSDVGADIWFGSLPLLRGAAALAEQGLIPGGTRRNLDYVAPSCEWDPDLQEWERLLAADAQTSGGLLIAVPPGRVEALLADLGARAALAAVVVGRIRHAGDVRLRVTRAPSADPVS